MGDLARAEYPNTDNVWRESWLHQQGYHRRESRQDPEVSYMPSGKAVTKFMRHV
jgi:hypothetical protein